MFCSPLDCGEHYAIMKALTSGASMSKTVEIVRALAATTKRTEKEQIVLDAWLSGERDFFVGCKMAYDQLLSFCARCRRLLTH